MLHQMLILGIETTCDETAAAVVERREDGSGKILSNVVHSQITDHAPFGGVVPEIAARAHVELLDGLIARAMDEAKIGFADLDGVAAAAGPGLIGGVIVGLTTAKAIALVHAQAAARGQSSRSACADRRGSSRRSTFRTACFSPPAAIPSSSPCTASATTRGSAPRSTTRSARRSTRSRNCSACPIPAGRRSSAPQRQAMPRVSHCRGRCSDARMRIFRCPA